MELDKTTLVKFRNEIACLPVLRAEPDDNFGLDDNLGIALASYFEDRLDCPEDDEIDESGWKNWAIEKTNDVLERVIEYLLGKLEVLNG